MTVTILASCLFLPMFLLGDGYTALRTGKIYLATGISPNESLALALVMLPEDTPTSFVFPTGMVFSCLLYSFITWCIVRIWVHLRNAIVDSKLAAKNRQLAVQINIVLTVQAVLPFLFDFLPVLMLKFPRCHPLLIKPLRPHLLTDANQLGTTNQRAGYNCSGSTLQKGSLQDNRNGQRTW